ncbi:MAG: NAD(P)/FAD-dependent oxidoreductase [Bacteroidota bacterium]
MKTIHTDVLIIGGGPAGSTMGSYLARNNIRCTIVEKEKFPREHVGESLVISCNKIFQDLDLFPDLEKANFPKKYGAAWSNTNKKTILSHDWRIYGIENTASVLFGERQQEGVHSDYTYHVDRGLFDQILLNKSRQNGAEVYEESFVTSISFKEDKSGVVCTAHHREEEMNIHAKMIVDASGRATVVGRALKIKENDPVFNQLAIHTWFEDYARNEDVHKDYIYIHFLPYSHTWVWQIPISETITSIGLVTHKDHIKKSNKSLDEIFHEFIQTKTDVLTRIQSAKQLKPFKMEADYSYKMKHLTGDNFILIGDAARYVDPIFSSGVSIALNAARIAVHEVIQAVKTNNFTKESFTYYNDTIETGCKNWYEFITLYYKLNVMFTWFISNPKYKSEVIRFLQGDVYEKEESFLIRDMKKMCNDIEMNENHILHQYLNKK